jgi:hypothetical protein
VIYRVPSRVVMAIGSFPMGRVSRDQMGLFCSPYVILATRLIDQRCPILGTGDIGQGPFNDKRGDRDARTRACRVATTIPVFGGVDGIIFHRNADGEKGEIGHESGSFPLAP